MSFGIGDNPFKAFSSNAEAGGGMGVYNPKRRAAQQKKRREQKEEETKLLDLDFDDEDDDYEIEDFNL